nr:1-deoxy-D-xylulose-5-phosphate synthase [Cyanobium sp. Prado107]
PKPPGYSKVFGQTLVKICEQDPTVVGITAAMATGTGLDLLEKALPDQYFDVGIAEQHAVTMAAGMACEGLRPVVAIYSTFLQRAYDQLIHDVGIQKLPVTFVMDRAGIVGADGPTHQGQYDISYLRCVPNFTVMAPKDEAELQRMLVTAIQHDGPCALRIPRGEGEGVPLAEEGFEPLQIGRGELLTDGDDHEALILPMARRIGRVVTIEEGALAGGFGAAVVESLNDNGVLVPVLRIGIPDVLVDHASPAQSKETLGLTPPQMAERIASHFGPALRSPAAPQTVGV